MKKHILIATALLILTASVSHAALTVGKIPVTRTGGTTPTLEDSIVTQSGGAVVVGGNLTASNISGNNTGDQTNISGNAATASALEEDPEACPAGQYVNDFSAAGVLSCGTPGDISDVWGGCSTGNCNALTAAAGDTLDATDADSTTPNKVATSCPATCTVGQTCFDSDATAGQNLYACTATNTWTLQGDGGAGITVTDTHVLFADGANNPAGDAGMYYLKAADIFGAKGGFEVGYGLDEDVTILTVNTATLPKPEFGWDNINGVFTMNKPLVISGSLQVIEFDTTQEQIDGSVDDYVSIVGQGGSDNTDLRVDVDGPRPVIDSATDSKVEIAEELVVNDGSNPGVVDSEMTRCVSIENLAAADDNKDLGAFHRVATIKSIWCECEGTCTTAATLSFEDDSANGLTLSATPTCATGVTVPTAVTVSSGGGLTARESWQFDVTNTPSPETDEYLICYSFTFDES